MIDVFAAGVKQQPPSNHIFRTADIFCKTHFIPPFFSHQAINFYFRAKFYTP